MTRLFVAIWPSPESIAALAVDVARAQGRHPQLRWQPSERWHVTLAFLGQADARRAQRRLDRLWVEPPTATALGIAHAGSFGPVLWVGVEHGAWLADLARSVQRTLHTADNRFRAHITVARGRGREARRDAAAAVPDLVNHRGPVWLPSEVTLVESVTGPTPHYTVLHTWPLTDGPSHPPR